MTAEAAGSKHAVLWRGLRLAAIYLIVPIAMLGIAELGLRGCGVGDSGGWLLAKEHEGAEFRVPSQGFYQQFTALPLDQIMNWDDLDFVLPREKAAATVRIFAFGESALYGTRSAARILEVLLDAAYSERDFEVYNSACPGMNSHVLRAIARDAARHEPDLFLIYMGNNEAVGPYGPTTPIGRTRLLWNPTAIQGLIGLNHLRLMQLVGGALPRPAATPSDAQIAASMPGQSRLEKVNAMYGRNLEAMIASAREADAPVVLCTLGSNKVFGGMDASKPASLDAIERGGVNVTVLEAARRHEGQRLALADVEQRLYEQSPSGVPDYTYFTDNIHFTFEGSYEAARVMFDAVVRMLGLPAAVPMPLEEAARHMGWGVAAQIELLRIQVRAGFDPYSKQRLQQQLERLEKTAPADLHAAMAADYEAALRLRPRDLYLLHGLFQARLYGGDAAGALDAAQRLAEAHPHARVAMRALAQAYGAAADARQMEQYRAMLEVYPDDKPSLAAVRRGDSIK